MSLAHELRVLDLESQIDLLDRLRLLTRFGSNLTNISGIKGSGKSWIAQRYLEAWSQDKNQSLLMCHPSQTDEQRRATILKQLVSSPLFNEQDTIVNSFNRLIEDQPCDIVIVIDDAQLLSESLLAELWSLVLEAQSNPAWNINVVLFTQGDRLDPILSRLSYGQETKPLALEIEALSEKEVEMFVELLVVKYLPEDARKRVRNQALKAPPLPGALMALGEQKVEKRIIIRSIIGSPVKIAILALALLLLIAGGYLWLFSQPGPERQDLITSSQDSTQQESASPEQTVIPATTTEETVAAESGADQQASTTSSSAPQGGQDSLVDNSGLPPEIPDNMASVGQSDDGQRVVVPSTVVDALLEGKQADTQIIDSAIEDATQKALAEENEPATSVAETANADNIEPVAPTIEQEPLTDGEPEVERSEAAPPLVTFSFAKQELLAISDRNYTLQLAALLSLEEVQSFINTHSLQDRVRIYPTLRNNTQWYIVTYKDFSTIQAARNAREELPESVQQLDPWAKSMLQVHREIERAN
ncbi:AAA family ATPase [Vibrio sp. SCSIO 43137]|uniref:AAA family ATPase n=1 Tax=Vibrio sp. SCSIO 43137 TaxID=3021011 RepID=UPI00230820E1|nr:AAA family ATPase [Vibrio sp. SCSIO 43137]WCE29913.1 AAA family ATPase [Vibrio sp. SCSIO 43137]